VGSQHPEPSGRGHPVRALGERERLTEQQLRLGHVTGGVAGAAADRQAPRPGCGVGGAERTVVRELPGLREAAIEIGRPRTVASGGQVIDPRLADPGGPAA
jgi:hypothetical protein